ncbi:lysozyme 3-like [Xenia sp. Carnegie-2017]|uniref:lysozyme 3-like n=1 Tax=Xenia sp. Carnegie-2017 TaxID=2897299 RepID=UPI001F049CDD|nr:lysozyme 3-like [Xenia sp. Carnegie-2017]
MSSAIYICLLLIALPYAVQGYVSSTCLRCICNVESGCRTSVRCGDNGRSCGPYQIQYGYWTDASSPGRGYRQCVDTFFCAETTIQNYMNRYATYARLGHNPTCEDYARIHNGGPNGYRSSSTLGYWQKIRNEGCTRYS